MTAFRHLSAGLLLVTPLAAQAQGKITQTVRATDPKTGLTVAGAAVELPADTEWRLEDLPAGAPVRQAMLTDWSKASRYPGATSWKDRYIVTGLTGEHPQPVQLTFTSTRSPDRRCAVMWNPAEAGDPFNPIGLWAGTRAEQWAETALPAGSLIDRWALTTPGIYTGADPRLPRRSGNMEPMDTFSVFGGRSAVVETLQMRDISDAARGLPAGQRPDGPVPLNSLPRVEVKSHPFAEMIREPERAPLPLASLCPPDRFFALFPQPKRLRTVMNQLAEVSAKLSSPAVEGVADYSLWQKYLTRMGLDEPTVQAWIEAGRAEAVAIVLPDLFVRDASDLTFLIQMKEGDGPALFKVLPETAAVLTVPGKGGQCYLARRGNVLIASTSAAEAAQAVKLADSNGQGSLGKSDELRCMREKLPDSAATVAWFYFSDPFIRRLTGPEVKIGQHRRQKARDAMEALTAAALLYQLDHGQASPDKETLIRKGYAFAPRSAGDSRRGAKPADTEKASAYFKDVTLEAGPVVRSAEWGALNDLRPLTAVPVTGAAPQEAQLYKAYVERYSDYWRQYFDPIAIRLDETSPGDWSLGTFVLPLVHNSLYSGLKEIVDTTRPAGLPKLEPAPVAMLGLVMKEETMRQGGQEIAPGLRIGGPGLTGRMAFALPDADPILQTGGLGGIQNLIQGSGTSLRSVGGIGVLVALLTRPLDVFLEVEDEKKALALLDSAARSNNASWIRIQTVYNEADGRRFYVVDFEGIVQLHIGVSIENGWMHLSNHPWSKELKVTGTQPLENSAVVIRVEPAAMQQATPGALFQARNAQRAAVLTACAELLPWMETLGLDPAAAQQRQLASTGYYSPLPEGVTFTARRPLMVPSLLSEKGEMQAAVRDSDSPGLLGGVGSIVLRTGFEEDGLRATLEWTVAP